MLFVGMNFSVHSADGLFLPVKETFARISPNGELMAVVVNAESHQKLEIISLSRLERSELFSTERLNAEKSAIASMEWVDNSTLIVSVVELTAGVAKLADTRNKNHLFVIDIDRSQPLVRYIESDGQLIDVLPQEENAILFARSGSTSVVYRIDTSFLHEWGKPMPKTALVDGGQFSRGNRKAEVDGVVIRWITSASGSVRAALRWKNEEGFALLIREDDASEWQVERAWPLDKRRDNKRSRKRTEANSDTDEFFLPQAVIEGTNEFVVLDEDESGRNSVYRYNYATQEKTLIYRHPSAEIVTVGLNHGNTDVLYIRYFEFGVIKYHYVEGTYRDVADHLATLYPNYSASIVATDANEDRFFVYMRSPTQPGRAFLYDQRFPAPKELFSIMPWIEESELAPSTAGAVENAGLEIEYFLTLPPSEDPLPLLVYPHGGPWGVGDSRQFNPVVQYLAARGMAVLQVNYRGSGGYGDDFVKEGKGEFGQRMLEDVEAAMAEVLENPSIDGDRVCVIGESYGGYAALMLAIRAPERFRCAASYAGVTDLGLLLGSYDDDSADFLLSLLIDEEIAADLKYEYLRKISPLYQANLLQVPVLIAHGLDDYKVDIEHSYRMVHRLNQLGRNVTWHELQDQGHSFDEPQAALDYYRLLANFVERHLLESLEMPALEH